MTDLTVEKLINQQAAKTGKLDSGDQSAQPTVDIDPMFTILHTTGRLNMLSGFKIESF